MIPIIAAIAVLVLVFYAGHKAIVKRDQRLVWCAIDMANGELTTLQIHEQTGVPIGRVHLIVDELEAKGQACSRYVHTEKRERGGRPERRVWSVL